MIVAVCIDERNGMAFNGRRLSRDKVQQEDLLAYCHGRLWVEPYSAPLFEGAEGLLVDEAFLQKAGSGEVCFVERQPLAPVAERVETVIVYQWNRSYPADAYLDLDLTAFTLTETREFLGSSHEKITRQIWVRK